MELFKRERTQPELIEVEKEQAIIFAKVVGEGVDITIKGNIDELHLLYNSLSEAIFATLEDLEKKLDEKNSKLVDLTKKN